ncbi:Adenosine receptor A3 [Trichoplax sp. H2]|nr:Adenosine receptor A3 [Trichoplax sp. H2]|eukprot:RDD37284.1 Adenosine receptor A3 [Trichoplax sp. H2]
MNNSSYLNESHHTLQNVEYEFYIPILVSICILSVFGNVLNLTVISRRPSLRDTKNILLISLNIIDLCIGGIALPCLIITSLHQYGYSLCQASGFIITYFNGVSLLMSAAITIDRCIAVVNPYVYLANLSIWRYTFLIICAYVISIPLAVLPLLPLSSYGFGRYRLRNLCWLPLSANWENYIILVSLAIGTDAVIITIFCCYLIIFYVAYNKSNSQINGLGSIKKSVRTTFLIVGTNVLCWLPLAATTTTTTFMLIIYDRQCEVNRYMEVIILMLAYCNAAMNPYIYAMTNEILKNEYKSLIMSVMGKIANICRHRSRTNHLTRKESFNLIVSHIDVILRLDNIRSEGKF